MACSKVSTLKFVGVVSLGLQTGLSYTLSVLILPLLSSLPPSASGSRLFKNLTTISLCHFRALASVSSSCFLLAHFLSPRAQKHPYLLWTTALIGISFAADIFPVALDSKDIIAVTGLKHCCKSDDQIQVQEILQMDASYEVLNPDDQIVKDCDEIETTSHMEDYMLSQLIRTSIMAAGFAMSVVGIWGERFGNLSLSRVTK
ncbi:BgTH12-05760 [Blumeria graminis f. sp. triticale]|uniref:Bgt-2518 n=3 Tax=Blumeria graminis TaxID=34373 RepID=A0A061HD65_BLUGR|nr:hypothetical protein BGT96224_2518 [Blumeria graminis f. sp. tritici 96224]CAD6504022.1 BgTH12-05760 [Blumeria graminis f. sp. triticale]VDB90753.1 Bgt-2518 [Blumeria graminis f. sp. tritici]